MMPLAHGGDIILIGQAAVGFGILQRALRRANVLALMTVAARALADEPIAQFAKVVAPWIAEILRRGSLKTSGFSLRRQR